MLDKLGRFLVLLLIFFLSLFFFPFALEPLESSKQLLLVVLTFGSALCWIGSMLAKRSLEYRPGWLNFVVLFPLAATAASALGSSAPYQSWIGGSSQEYMSALTVFACTLLFYLVLNRLPQESDHRNIHAVMLWSAVFAGAVGLWSALSGETFNTVGTLNALGLYLAAMTVFGCGLFVVSRPDRALFHGGWLGRTEQLLVVVLSLETLVLLSILDYNLLFAVLIAGLLLLGVFALWRARDIHDQRRFILPFLLVAVSVLFWAWLPPLARPGLPVEVTPSYAMSHDITRAVLDGESGLFGSGPGTFMFDYAHFHGSEVNQTPLWSQRFDRAVSYLHTIAPSLGLVGLLSFGLFLVVFLLRGALGVILAKSYRAFSGLFVDFSAWAAFAMAAFLYPGNMTSVFFLFVLAAMMSSHLVPESKTASFARSPQLSFVFSAAAVLISLGILTVTFVGLSRYGSEAALAKAVRLSEAGSDTSEVVDELDRAVRFNRFNDTAYRDLALSLIMRVNEELADLSDISAVSAEKRQYVQALSAAAIDAARRATDLSPRHVLNWLARGSVYRSLVPLIGDAGTFALEAYGQAIALEPVNPANHTELGKTYLVVAESVRELTGSADAVTAAQAKDELQANLAAAEAAFNKAVELKSDYAPAHYQLAVTYERQGRLNDAIGKMESVRKYNPLDVGVAFQLGMLYLRRGGEGDLARAQAEFERAIELAPAYANARWFLASIYESQGNVEAAIEQVAKVLEYDPGNEIVKARLARLKAGQISPTAPSTIEP